MFNACSQFETCWLPATKKTHVRNSKRAGCQPLRERMCVRHGWQPARPSKWTCARSMAGNQHSLEKEHAFGWWLANLSFSPTSSLSPNVCPWSAHDLPMVAPIFTGGHCKNAKKNCTCNFFSIFPKFWKIAIFYEKNRFF